MAEPFHYEIDQQGEDPIRLVMRGTLERGLRAKLGEAVDALLEDSRARSGVVIDLSDVVRCDPEAARTLARAQRRIASRGLRSAWVTTRARLRGVATWIVHAAEDPRAMPVTSLADAERWLSDDRTRLDALEAAAVSSNRASGRAR